VTYDKKAQISKESVENKELVTEFVASEPSCRIALKNKAKYRCNYRYQRYPFFRNCSF
jgi:hypothetical protein